MSFQISPLPRARFAPLFGLTDDELKGKGVIALTADASGGFPCRVGLRDANPGERILLLNFEHQPADSPFRSRYAIYVCDDAEEARLASGEVPDLLRRRTIAVRAFDADGLLVGCDLVKGTALEGAIERELENPDAAYLHLHYAKPGCYAARVDRV
jgi:hypothetical protein